MKTWPLFLALPGVCLAQECTPAWSSEFAGSSAGSPRAFLALDPDGPGPAAPVLYAAGAMNRVGGAYSSHVGRWDGFRWHALGEGLGDNGWSLAASDPDGPGGTPARLVVGGDFLTAGGLGASRVAQWDGQNWTAFGAGLSDSVRALTEFDFDGLGPAQPTVVAGGLFTASGPAPVLRIARWDGAAWQQLGAGFDAPVHALCVFDTDGSGPLPPTIYAGGEFQNSGATSVPRIARWTGSQWLTIGAGVTGAVYALKRFDADGTGPEPEYLLAGGAFGTIGGVTGTARIARLLGSTWSPLSAGVTGTVRAIGMLRPTGAPTTSIIIGGEFTTIGGEPMRRIASWDGSWHPLAEGASSTVLCLQDMSTPAGPQLLVGGQFSSIGPYSAQGFAAWDGSQWATLSHGFEYTVNAVQAFDEDGPGPAPPAIYAGGSFDTAAGVFASRIARYDGGVWTALGAGVSAPVYGLTAVDSPPFGRRLFVMGGFTSAGGAPAAHIAAWDGAAWSTLGAGVDGGTNLAVLFDADDTGPAQPELYVAGGFDHAGGVDAENLACWTGSSWHALSSPINGSVAAAVVMDDDQEGPILPALYVGGNINSAGSLPMDNIARWDGATWTRLHDGLNGDVKSLCVHDEDGPAPLPPRLFVAGYFTSSGQWDARYVVRWTGQLFTHLGTGVSHQARCLSTFDVDGPGGASPLLVAAGDFVSAGGQLAIGIAGWDGTAWHSFGDGIIGDVNAMALWEAQAQAPSLFMGGNFNSSGSMPAANFARLAGCVPCEPDCNGDTVLSLADFGCFQTRFAFGDPYADCNRDAAFNLADFGCFQTKFALGCP